MKERFFRRAAAVAFAVGLGSTAAACTSEPKVTVIIKDGKKTEGKPQVGPKGPKSESCVDVPMAAGQIEVLPKGSVISGDVKVNGTFMSDNVETTGAVVKLTQKATVEAPYGADARYGEDCLTAEEVAAADMEANPHFTTVDVVEAPGSVQGQPKVAPREKSGTQTDLTCTDVPMDQGQTENLPAGTVISGDIMVNGVFVADHVENTGLVTELTQAASVTAPYGADARYGEECITAEEVRAADEAVLGHRVDLIKAPGQVQG